jgi:hypothetical protein
MDEYGEIPIELLAFHNCNAADKFNQWIRSGGALLKNPNIGCGINTLTMLGVFSRKDGENMVTGLAQDPQRRGTSFYQIMQYIFHKSGRKHPMNELTGYIDTPTRLYHFLKWVDQKTGLNTCIIVKFNRDLHQDVLGHTVILNKDSAGILTIYDPQAERAYPLNPNTEIMHKEWIMPNGFMTASVILYRDTIDTDQNSKSSSSKDSKSDSKKSRRFLRVPTRRRNPTKNPETTSKYKKQKPLEQVSLSEPMDIDEIEPIPFHDLSKRAQSRLANYFHSPTEPSLVIPDFSERSMINLAEDNVAFMSRSSAEYTVRRRHLLPAPPVSYPISEQKLKTWVQMTCNVDRSCTEHALSILEAIPNETYKEMVAWQQRMAAGRGPDELLDILKKNRQDKFIHVVMLAGGTEENVAYAFEHIPPTHGVLVMISRDGAGAIGHSVIFAKSIENMPVLLDGTSKTRHAGMEEIMRYLREQELLSVILMPVRPSVIVYRGTKRKYRAVRRRTNRVPLAKPTTPKSRDSMSRKRARITKQNKPGINATAKVKRNYEFNQRRISGILAPVIRKN